MSKRGTYDGLLRTAAKTADIADKARKRADEAESRLSQALKAEIMAIACGLEPTDAFPYACHAHRYEVDVGRRTVHVVLDRLKHRREDSPLCREAFHEGREPKTDGIRSIFLIALALGEGWDVSVSIDPKYVAFDDV